MDLRASSHRRRFAATSLVVVAVGLVAAIVRCSQDDPVVVLDASLDRQQRIDSHPADTSPETDPDGGWDGAARSDWPGWRRLTEVDPNCFLDVPVDVDAQVPAIKWIACTTGQVGCTQVDTSTWGAPIITFANGWTSRDGRYLFFARWFDAQGTDFAQYVYHLPDLKPVAAWRAKLSSIQYCDSRIAFTEDQAAVLYRYPVTSKQPAYYEVQLGSPGTLSTAPNPAPLLPSFAGTEMYESFAASNTSFAFDVATTHTLVRGSWGSSNYVRTNWAGRVSSALVFGNDVFAWNEYGTGDGWHREVSVAVDGVVTAFRGVAQHHIVGFASDGIHWFWSEAYGGPQPASPQPTVDVYAAPYTNDPAILDMTKKKVVMLPPGAGYAVDALAFNGLYVIQPALGETDLVRESDGARRVVMQGGNHWCEIPLYATNTELWCIEKISPQGPGGVALTRVTLDPW